CMAVSIAVSTWGKSTAVRLWTHTASALPFPNGQTAAPAGGLVADASGAVVGVGRIGPAGELPPPQERAKPAAAMHRADAVQDIRRRATGTADREPPFISNLRHDLAPTAKPWQSSPNCPIEFRCRTSPPDIPVDFKNDSGLYRIRPRMSRENTTEHS